MVFLSQNIRNLRRAKGMTQEEFAAALGVKRSMIGSYEEGRAVPKPDLLVKIAHLFGVSIDGLMVSVHPESFVQDDLNKKQRLKILTTVVSPEEKERIVLVPVKASAGYLNGYADPEYVGQLPHFTVPVPELSAERTYRVFQIRGDSMLPVPPGAYIFCTYVEDVDELKEGKTYVFITSDEGVVYKRLYMGNRGNQELILKSDNPEYEPYSIAADSIIEIWRAIGYLCFDLPGPEEGAIRQLASLIKKTTSIQNL